jgi:hypothetical protein
MFVKIINFDLKYLKESAKLLQNAQRKQFQHIDNSCFVSVDFCEKLITLELEKEISSSHLLLHRDKVVGFAIATIKRDAIWGNVGWINLGGWSFDPEFIKYFPLVYQKIADIWVKEKIHQHCIMIFDYNKDGMDIFNNMGFARQQTFAVLNLSSSHDFTSSNSPYIYRRSTEHDQDEMNKFSRLIAEYQSKSPCFASAPLKYLESLDEGFSNITTDQEIDLFVVQHGSILAGYQGYYDTEKPDLIIPPKSVELAVSGVTEIYRGKGCGLNMTLMGLSEQKKRGFNFAVTDWRCANLLSSTFWGKIGFIPVAHRLIRWIDPLI